jgi:8-oxo-dGTP pyrophosphatase MutT (NUDIX family)
VSAPVPVRDAATVVLLRDGVDSVEAWLLTRVQKMAFASGMTVFPGGRVDELDGDLPWSGRDAGEFATDFGCEVERARSLVGAAVREVFEETGVLLCVPPIAGNLAEAQPEVEAGRIGFGELLRTNGLAIDADALRPWARWITPPNESRRYDTHFFIAALPIGARAADLTTESSVATWVPIAQALSERTGGQRQMLPPTISVLTSIAGYSRVEDVLEAAARRDLQPVEPAVRRDGKSIFVDLPDGSSVQLR